MKSLRSYAVHGTALAVAALVSFSSYGGAQDTPPAAAASAPGDAATAVRDLQDQVRQLRTLVEEMRTENTQSRSEMQQLRQDLQATRALLERPAGTTTTAAAAESAPPENGAPSASAASSAANTSAPQNIAPLEDRIQKLEDSTSLLGSKIDEHYQTKVETASKYRARLHGIVLMNAFRNVGTSNNLDYPDIARPDAAG